MSAGPAVSHRHGVSRSPVPRGPRRISGPTRTPAAREAARAARGSRSMAAAAGGAVALPRPVGVPTLLPRAVDALRRLPDNRWLDRLLRGQTWIVVIGIALMGIVAMQVSLLKMNAGIGRAVEHSSTLERQNADLRAAVSTLSSEERIQREAAAMGLVMPPAGDVRYVRARGAEDARRAASGMRPPNAPQPVDALAQAQAGATGAAVAGAAASGVTSATGAPAPTTTTAPTQAQATLPPEQQAAPPAEPQVQQQAAAPPAAQPQAATTGAATAPVATGATTP
jgi:hypothetical protein